MKTTLNFLVILVLSINIISFAQGNKEEDLGGLAPFNKSIIPAEWQVPDNMMNWNSRAFGYCAYPSPYYYGKFFLNNPYSWLLVASDPGTDFVSAGSFAPDGLYCIKFNNSTLYKLDTVVGILNVIAGTSGKTGNFSGLAYDWTTNTMYATTVWSNSYSQLYTINLTNGVCSAIGIQQSAFIIDIACSNSGQLYGVNILNDNFCSINKTTGAITPIGYIGFDAAYAQGLSWDHSTDSCFYASLRVPANVGELRRVNIQTGATTVIGSFGSVTEVDGFAIPGAPFPAKPLLSTPVNMSLITQPHTFKWFKSNTAISYRIQISTDSLFNNIVVNDSLLADTMKIVNGLSVNTWHYWKVNAKNSNGWSQWSSVWKFAPVNSAPETPLLNYPANFSNTSLPIAFKWYRTFWTNNYRIQIAKDSLFNNIVVNDSLQADTVKTVMNLEIDTLHYWRVNAKNPAGSGLWSTVWKFTPGIIPNMSYLYLPEYNASVNQPVTFVWYKVPYANTYRLQIATDISFNNVVYNDSTLADTVKILSNFQVNILHYWRVCAKNLTGIGEWSDPWPFLPGSVGINIISNELPIEYHLSQNYPNPFNPVTKINFAIPKQSMVILKIYDINGREIETLVDEVVSPGRYSVDFNGSEFSSGVYFYRIIAKDFTETKKMLMIK